MGFGELLVVLLVVILVFGANKIPALGDGLGKAVRNFKDAMSGKDAIDVTPKKVEPPKPDAPKPPGTAH